MYAQGDFSRLLIKQLLSWEHGKIKMDTLNLWSQPPTGLNYHHWISSAGNHWSPPFQPALLSDSSQYNASKNRISTDENPESYTLNISWNIENSLFLMTKHIYCSMNSHQLFFIEYQILYSKVNMKFTEYNIFALPKEREIFQWENSTYSLFSQSQKKSETFWYLCWRT